MTPTSASRERLQYADKLLGDIESILDASASKPSFPRYQPDVSPVQGKIVRDYIERIRSQMIRVLESQGVFAPEPQFGSVHSIRVTLGLLARWKAWWSVNARGFVELRSALSNIVARLESTSFEIAVFGRVSSGKSSLLNRIVERDVLPVGVNPVTSVPTRIAYGPMPRGVAGLRAKARGNWRLSARVHG